MKNVIVYSTETCPYCHRIKDFLKEKSIEFEDVDVSKNPEKLKEMVDKSKQMGVPVIDIEGTIFVGADIEGISEKLELD